MNRYQIKRCVITGGTSGMGSQQRSCSSTAIGKP